MLQGTEKTDYLIIGTGIAGLSLALKVADNNSVMIITKAEINTTNTNLAQGGIASVTYEPDTFEQHIKDTEVCGSNQGDSEVIRMIVEDAPNQIKELIRWGVDFDKQGGLYDLAREGGHTQSRILHHKDKTGEAIQRALQRKAKRHKNIKILEHHFAVDIITQHHLGELVTKERDDIECYGAYILNNKTGEVCTVLSKFTILSTGGVGNIYNVTTNPIVATGDGIAIAHRAKAKVEGMEFIQFHPTSLYDPNTRPSFLISEAMRGFGAILRNKDGEDFMPRYHQMGSLAPRDIVARSIDSELKKHGDDYVYLDVTHKPANDTIAHFPNIYQKCLEKGIDITKDLIPVVPAAHYCCGGIKVDMNGQTTINRLYAAGETSSTGLHGANRLASNSLIEAIVYAERITKQTLETIPNIDWKEGIPQWNFEGTIDPEEMVLITQSYKEMQQIMSYYVGIVRSNARLERAMSRMEIIYKETEELYKTLKISQKLCELRNMIAVAYIIIKHAREMKHSVGLHYTIDYPIINRTSKQEF